VTREQIRAAVLDALASVAPETDAGEVDPAASLREQLELDSMDHLNFMIALDEALGVEIPEADYPRLQTLDQVVMYLERRLAGDDGARGAAPSPTPR
jgi:acyl carrier protein